VTVALTALFVRIRESNRCLSLGK